MTEDTEDLKQEGFDGDLGESVWLREQSFDCVAACGCAGSLCGQPS